MCCFMSPVELTVILACLSEVVFPCTATECHNKKAAVFLGKAVSSGFAVLAIIGTSVSALPIIFICPWHYCSVKHEAGDSGAFLATN